MSHEEASRSTPNFSEFSANGLSVSLFPLASDKVIGGIFIPQGTEVGFMSFVLDGRIAYTPGRKTSGVFNSIQGLGQFLEQIEQWAKIDPTFKMPVYLYGTTNTESLAKFATRMGFSILDEERHGGFDVIGKLEDIQRGYAQQMQDQDAMGKLSARANRERKLSE